MRPISAEACAQAILRGVDRDQGVIVISRLVQLEWALYRLSPRIGVTLGRVRGRRFHDNRQSPPPGAD